MVADIVVSTDAAARNAKVYRSTPAYEAYLYVAHGILHCVGYDDASARERAVMQHKAEKILSSCNITV